MGSWSKAKQAREFDKVVALGGSENARQNKALRGRVPARPALPHKVIDQAQYYN